MTDRQPYISKSQLAQEYGLPVRTFMAELNSYPLIKKMLDSHGKFKKTLPPFIVKAIRDHLDG